MLMLPLAAIAQQPCMHAHLARLMTRERPPTHLFLFVERKQNIR